MSANQVAPEGMSALRAEVEGWKQQHARDSAELRRLCAARDEASARAALAKAKAATQQALLDTALETLRQIASTPRNRGARLNAAGTLHFIETQQAAHANGEVG